MERRSQVFLESVLGADGAAALNRVVERSPEMAYALVPRGIMAWVGAAPAYDGEIPGVAGGQLSFSKSEVGYDGSISVNGSRHDFEDHSISQVSALVAIALGVPAQPVPEDLRDIDLARLGKSIDLLARAHYAHAELAKKSPPGKFNDLPEKLKDKGYSADKAFAIAWSQHNKEHKSERSPDCEHCAKMEKAQMGAGGQAAAPIAPTAPEPPTAAAPTPSAKPAATPPKIKQAQTVKLTRSEAGHVCRSCGGTQFRGERFVACICFRDLQKNAKVIDIEKDSITLRLDWEPEVVLMFLESIGR